MPRLSIQIDDALDDRLNKFLPWGTKQRLMESIIIMTCDAVELHGKGLVGLLLNQEFNLITQEMQKIKKEASDGL